ncbi:helix-turn-helix domain-containing protein [Sinorhizobium medicae]|uniref:helix-turn-helix domain-containing protein n=1 Tax=Sinorhizobium medicae TaxID=110321 RepID=UPI0004624F40|nr:helix-turn-helix domain-containing protein [Sinorhizobium medicae]MDX0404867.1 helix-turn-helix domain-containing protein [Sinorhizobium medicae]MDX0416823.1 helix-turn-helix domain-containing protein [Sinorhizobium medicae]MDX0448083.1 helix-turn-helix domain-containing protein [Sinorhizobium medicae]MDX0458669.1 helix-turn-helix domain-containing protein [Sinorhizobium medicae]MDX0515474.1 helix-turn-helix domain-containing protein [Sinorhizobium medicae]
MNTSISASWGRHINVIPPQSGEPALAPISSFVDGQCIYSCGERADQVYRVEFGAVRVYRLLANGRRQILAFHFGGDWFGLQSRDRHSLNAEAIGVTGVRCIGLQEEPLCRPALFSAALENFSAAQEHQLVIGRQSAIERVAAFLLEMSERSGYSRRFELSMSRVDVADYLALTIETVSRSLTKLKHRGFIELHGARGIELVGYRGLQNLCL